MLHQSNINPIEPRRHSSPHTQRRPQRSPSPSRRQISVSPSRRQIVSEIRRASPLIYIQQRYASFDESDEESITYIRVSSRDSSPFPPSKKAVTFVRGDDVDCQEEDHVHIETNLPSITQAVLGEITCNSITIKDVVGSHLSFFTIGNGRRKFYPNKTSIIYLPPRTQLDCTLIPYNEAGIPGLPYTCIGTVETLESALNSSDSSPYSTDGDDDL